jgi:hypothetical protein
MAKSGTPFEIEVRDFMQNEINKGALGIDPQLAVVRHKYPYWSQKRNDNIITDVSIEFYRPNSKDYWLLWVIECKDLGHLVPVDDIEEFDSKLKQMNVHKGSMASRLGFAAGCTAYAKNSGIGLMRFSTPGRQIVLLEHEELLSDEAIILGAPEAKFPGDFAGYTFQGEFTSVFARFIKIEMRDFFAQKDDQR